jgi:hypothetical protein
VLPRAAAPSACPGWASGWRLAALAVREGVCSTVCTPGSPSSHLCAHGIPNKGAPGHRVAFRPSSSDLPGASPEQIVGLWGGHSLDLNVLCGGAGVLVHSACCPQYPV